MKILSALLGLILCVVALCFALSNRQGVTVILWPFDLEIVTPLYLLVLGMLALGLLFGGMFIWLGMLKHRFRARRFGKDVVALSARINDLERELAERKARDNAEAANAPALLSGTKWKFWERM